MAVMASQALDSLPLEPKAPLANPDDNMAMENEIHG
jgi:hypothetical protein